MTHRVLNFLMQLQKALETLEKKGKTTFFYVSKMDFEPNEKNFLDKLFQKGSIFIEDKSEFQGSQWFETRFAGIWRGTLLGIDKSPIVEIIEVAHFPSLLRTTSEEIQETSEKLHKTIEEVINGNRHDIHR